jgi:serine/threonine-protein kinase
LHRDLKPENVFLCAFEQATPFVKLLDFGISKQLTKPIDSTTLTQSGMVLGTAAYMSPEQATGDVELDVRSDLYSLGALLYECLTGTQPHRGRTYESLLVDICTRDADDVRIHCPLISEALATTIRRAVSRDRSARYESATRFLDALRCAVPELSVDSGPKLRAAMATTELSLSPSVAATPSVTKTSDRHLDPLLRTPRVHLSLGIAVALALSIGAFFLVQRFTSSINLNAKGTYPEQTRANEAASTPPGKAAALPTTGSLANSPPPSAAHEGTSRAETFNTAKVSALVRSRTEGSHPQQMKPRPSHTGVSTAAPEVNSGVAGDLKLRRTMP